jgi:hypothetical protein
MRAAVAACATVAAGCAAVVVVSPAVAAPVVETMVVGSGGVVLSQPHTVSASAASVRVGGRSCAVAAGTPLAALAGLDHLGGPPFSLRDYGRCGSSARNSGQLFVYRLGGETNRGQNGWEYKVDRVSGTTGAADTSGPRGNGRLLASGDRVLWFWCQASAGGCQRTLEVSAPSSVSRGRTLAVQVTGYDNEGRGRPVAGAIVTLGSDFASTNSSGRATVLAPSSGGHYSLSAKRGGLVPSFPETIVVR